MCHVTRVDLCQSQLSLRTSLSRLLGSCASPASHKTIRTPTWEAGSLVETRVLMAYEELAQGMEQGASAQEEFGVKEARRGCYPGN